MVPGLLQGGTSIEDLAEKYPEKIIKIPVDCRTGITDAQVGLTGLSGRDALMWGFTPRFQRLCVILWLAEE